MFYFVTPSFVVTLLGTETCRIFFSVCIPIKWQIRAGLTTQCFSPLPPLTLTDETALTALIYVLLLLVLSVPMIFSRS